MIEQRQESQYGLEKIPIELWTATVAKSDKLFGSDGVDAQSDDREMHPSWKLPLCLLPCLDVVLNFDSEWRNIKKLQG